MSNQPSMNIWYIFFALLGVATLVAFGIAIWQDTYPGWITYQKAYYEQKYEDAKVKYEQASNERERARWRKRLTALKNPQYKIKQILLGNGTDVDRCITCHLDESNLKKTHPRSKEFPFQKFGCTACHGGDGRATTINKAHAGIGMDNKAKVEKYLSMRTHPSNSSHNLDPVHFWTTGEKIQSSTWAPKCVLNVISPGTGGMWRGGGRQSLRLLTVSKRGSTSSINRRKSPLRPDPPSSSVTPAMQPDMILRRMSLRKRGQPARPATAQGKYTPN
jgi:hypothetical protein